MTGNDPIGPLRIALAGPVDPAFGSSDYDLNPGSVPPEGRALRKAAVLVGLIDDPSGWQVLLTKRSSRLRHHPGQIAFPGGKLDPDDDGPEAAALREAREEVGLPSGLVDILGRLPSHETVTGFDVVPVVAQITAPFRLVAELGEVAEIFTVPLAHVTDASRFRIEGRRWRGQRRLYYTVPYGPYYIWGATARILRMLAERSAR
ncbi:CoA pyrophosphatase [Pseudoruegeria sp. SK021]|uniref:CoA pyrophosphatase n=1 Tax=Pseudoruegeria sp. SK021 TaxID=1933035 RepID=UPI000A21FE7F|nr:CoA pyrophosphatase [Pseudoruegeria sp. SK021]OSP54626.1 CoA pyrophosphatase [Pseudoruegeria sp. SK021]